MSLERTIATNIGANTVKPCSKFSNTFFVSIKTRGFPGLIRRTGD